MANQSDNIVNFKVYQIVPSDSANLNSERYMLEIVGSFNTYIQAINFINNEGNPQKEYAIIEVFKKRQDTAIDK